MGFWPDSLVREIAERRVILFLGAGVSRVASSSLPTWSKLLTNLSGKLSKVTDRSLVSKFLNQGRMLDAAQIIVDGVPHGDLTAKLVEIFQILPIPNHKIYNDLLSMDPKIVVTTNYDNFVENNFAHYSGGTQAYNVRDHKVKKFLNDLRSPARSILKMHGSITDPHDIILDRVSYFKAKDENPSLFKILSAIMTVNTVLFIGYSINDPDIQLILENINLGMKSDLPHYCLCEKFDHASIRSALLQTYNVSFLEYTKGDFSLVPQLIDELKQDVEMLRAVRGIV